MLTISGVRELGYRISDSARGTILSPGKFEGEPWFVVSLWEAAMEGLEGERDADGYWVRVTEETAEFFGMDREVFPIGSYLYLYEDDQGFVRMARHAKKIETVSATGLACWASYLINGDASGIDDDDVMAADAFAKWLGGRITDVSEESFFDVPDHGTRMAGDCVTYTAIVEGK